MDWVILFTTADWGFLTMFFHQKISINQNWNFLQKHILFQWNFHCKISQAQDGNVCVWDPRIANKLVVRELVWYMGNPSWSLSFAQFRARACTCLCHIGGKCPYCWAIESVFLSISVVEALSLYALIGPEKETDIDSLARWLEHSLVMWETQLKSLPVLCLFQCIILYLSKIFKVDLLSMKSIGLRP